MRNRRHRTKRRGFTLLEVMLVLGILVMLAIFVVPQIAGTSKAAKKDAAKAMVGSSGTISNALELFYQRIGRYPEKLIDLVERPDDLDDEDDRWYQFLKEPNFKDPWQNELVYKFPGDVHEDGFDLICVGPDGEEGTEDDIANFRSE